MPSDTLVVITVVGIAFAAFAFTLAWIDVRGEHARLMRREPAE